MIRIISLITILALINTLNVDACSAFILKQNDSFVTGINFDFDSNQGMLMINPRGLKKKAIPFAFEKPASWISKYGSLTYNFLGREEPMQGINEQGLVVAALFLPETELEKKDKRPMVDDMQWIQYMLDNCADIEEVISKFDKIRISKKSRTRIHYFLSDAKGNFAFVEFIGGECKYYLNDTSTNGFICAASFEKSVENLKRFQPWSGGVQIAEAYNKKTSLDVVAMGSDLINKYEGKENIKSYAFNILLQVEAPRNSPTYGTHWTIVFDNRRGLIYFKTMDNREVREIDLSKVDFDCNSDFKALNITDSKPKDIYSQFSSFSPAQNMTMFKNGFKVFLKKENLPMYIDKAIERVANIPYDYTCE
jgi:choloylglycine hydrolase